MADLKERIASLSPRQRELLAKRLGERRAGTDSPSGALEHVAIIGMACRFPGGADSPEALWRMLAEGRDAVGEVPPERWDPQATPDPDSVRWGAFLDHVDRFDAAFFGISPREAAVLDPQHRLLLEISWEALEDAGLPPDSLAGSTTGVFAALYHRDYARLALADPGRVDAHVASGTHHSLAANRLSYHLDLRGPSLVVDTACSSSLVALHLACCSLRRRECDTALVGAANVILLPDETLAQAKLGILAADGRSKTFDARADGFGRGEGCGVLVLRRRADAEAAGDHLHALIRGTAVNQDGRSNGLTAPNGEAQQEVIRDALAKSGLDAGSVTYVETHGTGTRLGDPIEVEALAEILDDPAGSQPPCLLGAVKANLGHTEATAGIAGVLKTVLCLRHGAVPPQIHFRELNPLMSLAGSRFRIPTELTRWKSDGSPRRAGVSSFGIGGTNAHVILEQAPEAAEPPPAGDSAAYLLPLSARSPSALAELAAAWRQWLASSDASTGDLVAAGALQRSHHQHRAAAWGRTRDELAERLDAIARGKATEAGKSGGLVFVFSGQGWQWPGMGRELYSAGGVFRDELERSAAALERHGVSEVLRAWRGMETDEREPPIELLQPLLFALQVALAAQWRAWGVLPDAVIGHSLGEVAAAHVAGALTLDDAASVVCHRSRLLVRARGGAMAAVELTPEEAEEEIGQLRDRLSVAAENSPRSTVLAGDEEALEQVLARLEARGVFCRRIRIDVASHSPRMDPLLDEMGAALAGLVPRSNSVPFYSAVSAEVVDGEDLGAGYWRRNLRQPVRFWSAAHRALTDGYRTFLEVSGHPVLLPALEQGLAGDAVLLASWRRDRDERAEMLAAVGELYFQGREIAWDRVCQEYGYASPRRRVSLPSYPWQRQRFWVPAAPAARPASVGPPALFGAERLDLGGSDSRGYVWQGVLDPERFDFLADHRVQDSVILPGVGYLGVVMAAAEAAFGPGPHRLSNVRYARPLLLDPPPVVQWTLRRLDAREALFECHSRSAESRGTWALHADGKLRLSDTEPAPPPADLHEIRARCDEELAREDFYLGAKESGNHWGPLFRAVERVHLGNSEALVRLRTPPELLPQLADHPFHAAVLDACGQPLVACLRAAETPGGAFVLGDIEEIRFFARPGASLWSHLSVEPDQQPGRLRGDIRIFDDDGTPLAELLGLAIEFLEHRETGERLEDCLYTVRWREADDPPTTPAVGDGGSWLILADSGGVGRELARLLGDGAVLVTAGERHPGQPGADRRVVDLRGLDAAAGSSPAETPAEQAARVCDTALDLPRELAAGSAPRAMWWVTAGARGIDGPAAAEAPVSTVASTLWGLASSLAAEHPGMLTGMIDLDPGLDPAKAAEQLRRELIVEDGETQVALRDGRRYVPRLARRALPETGQGGNSASLSPSASYLITGGLGGLGLAVARRFVDRGARRLILLSRTPLPPRKEWRDANPDSQTGRQVRAILDLERQGASVHLAAIDVGREDDLRALLETWAEEERPPIRGVIHAAGVQRPRPALKLDDAALEAEMRAKVSGGLFLHRAFAGDELDFFVLFSSAATFLPSPFLAAYTAANMALVELAHERRRLGLPALVIEWGVWSQVGMGAQRHAEHARSLIPRGMRSFSPPQALDILERLLASDGSHVAALPMDWRAWAEAHPTAAAAPLLESVLAGASQPAPAERDPEECASDSETVLDFQTLRDADPERRREAVGAYLRDRLAAVLRASPNDVPLDAPLTRLGLDSLMAIELKNRIHAEVGTEIPIIRLLGSPGLGELVDHILPALERVDATEELEEWTI